MARAALSRGELVNAEQILNTADPRSAIQVRPQRPAFDSALDMLSQVYLREKRYADAVATQQWRLDIWTAAIGENGVVGRPSPPAVVLRSSGKQAISSPPNPTPAEPSPS